MEDDSILQHISNLVDEENTIRGREEARGPSPEDRQRLERIGVMLDQCWDLLRQRRALREVHADPDLAGPRDVKTVEHYQQ